jgi:ABC-type multidrug transport system ATPase subunit
MSASGGSSVLKVEGLYKTFRLGFFRKRVEAVRGVSFDVKQGETFGLLGPNGAGKTTSIKSILRLILPDAGQVRRCRSRRAGALATCRRTLTSTSTCARMSSWICVVA